MKKNLKEFISYFNKGNFFEAHEVLEDLWRKTLGTDKDALQGLIQLAVACHHAKHKNEKGAFYEYSLARKKLTQHPPITLEINLKKLLSDAEIFFSHYKLHSDSSLFKIQTVK